MRKLLPRIAIYLALALGPIACSTSSRDGAGTVHPAHANHGTIELNGGKKWVMDEPMMVHIRNLERDVQDFERSPKGDDVALARQIQDNLGRFVTSCTMEAKAHDQLHKWLMPLLGVSAEYAKATDPQVQREKLQEIKASLQVFHSYFE
jgi:hypothetical protein